MSLPSHSLRLASLLGLWLTASGCIHFGSACGPGWRGAGACDPCDPCGQPACGPIRGRLCRGGACNPCGGPVANGYACASAKATNCHLRLCSAFHNRSGAIPDTLPLGSTVRSWYQVMETNGEAVDFIIYQHEFIGQTARLTPAGRDHVWEIAARMKSTPFPVIVERTDNNSDPELDALRRQLVVSVLAGFGNPDADHRTVVSPSYGPGYNAMEAEPMYYQHLQNGGFNNYGSFGNNAGTYGAFGGGIGGGIGFGP